MGRGSSSIRIPIMTRGGVPMMVDRRLWLDFNGARITPIAGELAFWIHAPEPDAHAVRITADGDRWLCDCGVSACTHRTSLPSPASPTVHRLHASVQWDPHIETGPRARRKAHATPDQDIGAYIFRIDGDLWKVDRMTPFIWGVHRIDDRRRQTGFECPVVDGGGFLECRSMMSAHDGIGSTECATAVVAALVREQLDHKEASLFEIMLDGRHEEEPAWHAEGEAQVAEIRRRRETDHMLARLTLTRSGDAGALTIALEGTLAVERHDLVYVGQFAKCADRAHATLPGGCWVGRVEGASWKSTVRAMKPKPKRVRARAAKGTKRAKTRP